MIDIHNHIIYGVDDGAGDMEQSLRMIRAACDAGVTEICFTPHYMEDGYKTARAVLEEKVYQINKHISEENLNLKLYLGEEIFIFPELPQNLEKVISLNDSKYVMMELPLVEEVCYVDDVIYGLLAMDKVPIIAHPERYLMTEKDFSFLTKLTENGALLQVNINSLVGHYGKSAQKIAERLLKERMVHFVASDAHSSHGYLKMKESLKVLGKMVSEEMIQDLTVNNPRKVLLNQEIERYERVPKEKKGLFQALKKKVG